MKRIKFILMIVLIVGVVMFSIGTIGACIQGEQDCTYEAENYNFASIEKINLSFDAGDVKILHEDVEDIQISCPRSIYYNVYSKIEGAELRIYDQSKRHFNLQNNSFKTKIILPKNFCCDLAIDMSAGVLSLDDGEFNAFNLNMSAGVFTSEKVSFQSCCVKIDAGSVDFSLLDCTDVIMKMSAGSIKAKLKGSNDDYNISSKVEVGSCNVSNQSKDGAIRNLNVEMDAGKITILFEH